MFLTFSHKCDGKLVYMVWIVSIISILHVSAIEAVVEEDPCNPDPCGPYVNPPRRNGDRCDCSCKPDMIGSPPNCKPECIFNNDCPTELACKTRDVWILVLASVASMLPVVIETTFQYVSVMRDTREIPSPSADVSQVRITFFLQKYLM
jgi:hypothetical protein